MKQLLLIAAFLAFGLPVAAQNINCPAGYVCTPQKQFNEVVDKLNELIAARDVIAKLQAERGASDATLAAANKLIEDYKQALTIRDSIDAKKDAVISLYEKTIQLYASLVEKLENKINAPKSAFARFITALKEIGLLAAGIALGRGF